MTTSAPRRVVAFCASPRRQGNSRLLAEALLEGVAQAGYRGELVHLPDHIASMLRNCRECRRPDGSCSIEDGYRAILYDKFLPADAVVFASPIWWFGMSAYLKTFFDRTFCYYAASCPDHERVVQGMMGKRAALLLSTEESTIANRLSIVTQAQELCRYLHYNFVGVVVGIGNATGEIRKDPTEPLRAARELGLRLFEIQETDYKMETPRSTRVWQDGNDTWPSFWR